LILENLHIAAALAQVPGSRPRISVESDRGEKRADLQRFDDRFAKIMLIACPTTLRENPFHVKLPLSRHGADARRRQPESLI